MHLLETQGIHFRWLHSLAGRLLARSSFYPMWEELGAVQGRRFVNHEEFMRIEGPDGKTFIVYTDVDRLEQHMKELAPADAAVIEEFCSAVRLFTRFEPPNG